MHRIDFVKWIVVLVGVVAILGLTACRHVNRWERGKIAHPTMNAEVAGPAAEHMQGVQEGAVGGGSTVESGCGCN